MIVTYDCQNIFIGHWCLWRSEKSTIKVFIQLFGKLEHFNIVNNFLCILKNSRLLIAEKQNLTISIITILYFLKLNLQTLFSKLDNFILLRKNGDNNKTIQHTKRA